MSFQRDFVSFERDDDSFKRDCLAFERDCASFERDCASFERDCASFERDCASFERDCLAFERDCASFERDCLAFERDCASFERDCASFERDSASFESDCASFERDCASFEKRHRLLGRERSGPQGNLMCMPTGICFDSKDDELLAQGWPHLAKPIDGHKADKAPGKAALKAHGACDPIYFTEWPRQTLSRFLRIEASAVMAPGKTYDERMAQMNELATKASEDASPLLAAEAIDGLTQMFRKSEEIYPFQSCAFVYGVETIAGTDAVLDVLARELDACTPKSVTTAKTSMAQAVGFLLLRASPPCAKRTRAALDKTYAAANAQKTKSEDFQSHVEALDCALHGADAVRRSVSGDWVDLDVAFGLGSTPPIHFADDPKLVQKLVARADATGPMSVRVAFLGGPSVLSGLARRKWPAAQIPSVVRDFGMIRAPEVVELMLALISKSSAKDGPIHWFRSHADYARPLLTKAKSDTAKAVLRQLG